MSIRRLTKIKTCLIIVHLIRLMDPDLRSGQETYQYMELCR